MPNKTDTKKLRLLYNGVKSELETIYITSAGDKFIKEMDALCAESQIQQAKESKEKRRQNIMGIMELLLKSLEGENWGIYYKNEPIRSLNTKDGNMLYEINTVCLDEIERVLLKKLKESLEQKGESWKTHTIHHSQQDKDSKQS